MTLGKFITVEGIEGAGKSTQIAFIQDYLEQHGIDVVLTREPGGTRLGEEIRSILLSPREEGMSHDAELLLMFAARAEHIERVIKPALASGQWVLCDRFVDATFAYQGGGRGIEMQRIQKLADWTLADLQSDITFLFDLPVALGQQRVAARNQGKDRFEREKVAFFENIRACYLDRASKEPNRMVKIDASQSLAGVQSQLVSSLSQLLNQ
jgi:dTMP kinase